MAHFIWCKNAECRIPSFRCLLCNQNCYGDNRIEQEINDAVAVLLKTGRYRERFIMKRKANILEETRTIADDAYEMEVNSEDSDQGTSPGALFMLEDGSLKTFSPADYTTSMLYKAVETFVVETKLVRPEEPGHVVYEGKKPARKTVPILISKAGEAILCESWESLEANPTILSNVREVVGSVPVRQVFVLKRKAAQTSEGAEGDEMPG